MARNLEFDQLIVELVDHKIRHEGLKLFDVAIELGIREDHVRKINSSSSDKRYTIEHLYLLSKVFKCSIEEFIPSVKNLKKLERFMDVSDEEIEINLQKIVEKIRGDEKYE
ncbi:hypothetical protein [Macrococcoides caseolyticum]|uniref:hypothetical protein n=1 Tax=Macrococcoides caseolyticum TaxID=69966 RepID=UPI0020B7FD01|nr:hypothetical protein [Macrococcus caseolyticus]UTH05727.1 hypothetical protein KFV06_10855 [Macrococcus caseolyticus]